MPCMPARRMIVLKPIVHHSVATRMEIHAHGFDVSQPGLEPKVEMRKRGTTPSLPLNIHHHVRPTTATERVHGAKNTDRKMLRPRRRWLSNVARNSPTPTSSGVLMRTKRIVFHIVVQKRWESRLAGSKMRM